MDQEPRTELTDEAFERYRRQRYAGQIEWYSRRSTQNKHAFHALQWTAIVLSALVPALILTLPASLEWLTVVVAVMLAIATSASQAFRFHENWLNYRTTSETLKKEQHLFDAGAGEYGRATDARALFVERVEALISRENSLWVVANQPDERS